MATILRISILVASLSLMLPAARAGYAYVLNSKDDDISLIDTKTYKVIRRIPAGKEPHHLIPTPDNTRLIVANAAGNDLVLYDPLTANRLNRVDIHRHDNGTLTPVAKIPMPDTPGHMAFRPDSRVVYVTVQETHQVTAIDLPAQKVLWKMTTGKQPAGIWLTPDSKHLLVGITGDDFVQVLSPDDGRTLQKLKTGKSAHNFLPKGDGRHVFLSNRTENTISVIDMKELKVVDTIPVPGGPDDMELTADGSELWITSRWINRVTVIDLKTKKIKASIRVGRSPHGIYFHTHAPRI